MVRRQHVRILHGEHGELGEENEPLGSEYLRVLFIRSSLDTTSFRCCLTAALAPTGTLQPGWVLTSGSTISPQALTSRTTSDRMT